MKTCCDEYCDNYGCNQGRNCPAGVAKVGRRIPAAEPLTGPTWRDYMRELAPWALVVMWMLTCLSLLTVFL